MNKNIDLPIFILAGGRGTRLASVVNDVPKPLAPVFGKPFLHYLLENYINQGFRRFFFLLHFKSDLIIEYVRKMKATFLEDTEIQFSVEPSLLGTGGAVSYALNFLKYEGEFLIVNADTWVDKKSMFNIADSASPSMAVIYSSDVSRYGKVSLDKNLVLEFEEKRENAGAGWINAGLYKLHSSVFDGRTGEFSMETDVFPDLVQQRSLRAVPLDTEFIDIGIPEDYIRFQNWITSGREIKL
ncbi:sugar phosphate nucleotidyltransferase [Leptospira levettii]|uniref:Sugar phosphate nucleotidyltransferase n=1 Tax=Leptospira levettii TaxID=2023178 RepID=A0AAW5VGC6_9LEPT|nr:sugar phosphate nucleotidyltransferase [Leptospira levettii]MCW7466192.1 sugar phosphate nucleotidyltransferase [Leptospira levettii]MCW7512283.1 sugar phosphate nucleotidyltransferase [Leptospira levettii]MCW7516291.1 sugar phosphate nucleotidyltransferase [Leptospira levettii]